MTHTHNHSLQNRHQKTSWISASCSPGLVSVIIPTHNRAHLIGETLDSLLAQSYRPIECIVVDDGSTDDTAEILEAYGNQAASGFSLQYLFQDRRGAQVARNRGTCLCRGEFIQYLDSDDLLSTRKIELQVARLQNAHCNRKCAAYGPWRCSYLLVSGHSILGPRYQTKARASSDSILRGYLSGSWYCPFNSYLFARSSVADAGPWNESLQRAQDSDFLIRTLLTQAEFYYVPDALAYYRRTCGDHIGSEKHFVTGFASWIESTLAWSTLLQEHEMNSTHGYELLGRLSLARRDARVRGYDEGVRQCDEVASGIQPDLRLRESRYRSDDSAYQLLRRPAKRLLVAGLGEWGLAWIRYLLRRETP